MLIYLAASWPQRMAMREIAKGLSEIGHTVTSHWIHSESPTGMDATDVAADPIRARQGSNRDLLDIGYAELIAVFTDVPSSTGGLHVEFGYALAGTKPIHIIGPRLNVFYAPNYPRIQQFNYASEWFDYLRKEY
jgi:hypothetical protein